MKDDQVLYERACATFSQRCHRTTSSTTGGLVDLLITRTRDTRHSSTLYSIVYIYLLSNEICQ